MIRRNRGYHLPTTPPANVLIFAHSVGHRVLLRLAFASLTAFAVESGMPLPASAVPIEPVNYMIDFDLVKVTARTGSDGSTILSASALGNGPFATLNGFSPVDFDSFDSQGNETNLNGLSTGQIFANYLSPRYFGSDAEPKGAILLNLTNFNFTSASDVEQVAGVSIGGFQIWVAQPAFDNIGAVDGGNAFSLVSVAGDQKSVLFAGANIANTLFPAPGETEEMLWSAFTGAPQPPSADVFFVTPMIPPDPNGEFADMRLVGAAVATPEPSSILVLLAGLTGFAAILWRRRRGLQQDALCQSN
jgi:hypothetical protein